jgi:uncharacterized protein with PIN domain
MKLLADAMLGRLAKWLRVAGYDTAYLADTDDFAVMRLARAEDRLVLTRDTELAQRQGVRALFINSEVLEEQVRQVYSDLGPPPEGAAARCPVCNRVLIQADRDTVASRVPPYVLRTQEQFTLCTECDRVYWQGTHWEKMEPLIQDVTAVKQTRKLRDAAGFDKMHEDSWDSEQRRSSTGTN